MKKYLNIEMKTIKNIRIDYHTGTGGSKLVAEKLSKKLKSDNTNVEINRIVRDKITGINELNVDYYILVFPVHSFNAPKPIYEWVKHLAGNNCKTAVISVSGGGNVITNSASRHKTVKFLKKSNFNVIFEDMIRLPNNWLSVPDKKKYTRILSKLPDKIDSISQDIVTEKKKRKIVYWIDYLISALGEAEKRGTNKFGNGIKVLDTCTGCGLCAKNCCSSNIQIESQTSTDFPVKPTFGNRCDMCLGCIYNCPRKALQPTKLAFQVDKKGYDLELMCKDIL
jgi:ferredoxin/flavodoxin